jgi:A/G-specific adenine glycosylase
MDVGATICRPRAPACLACPLLEDCRAAASGEPESFPGRSAKKLRPDKVGAFLARRRPERGLLAGTLELPGGAWTQGEIADVEADAAPFPARWMRLPGHVEHVFTHFRLRLALFRAEAPQEAPKGLDFVAREALETAGFSGLMRKATQHAMAGG